MCDGLIFSVSLSFLIETRSFENYIYREISILYHYQTPEITLTLGITLTPATANAPTIGIISAMELP